MNIECYGNFELFSGIFTLLTRCYCIINRIITENVCSVRLLLFLACNIRCHYLVEDISKWEMVNHAFKVNCYRIELHFFESDWINQRLLNANIRCCSSDICIWNVGALDHEKPLIFVKIKLKVFYYKKIYLKIDDATRSFKMAVSL